MRPEEQQLYTNIARVVEGKAFMRYVRAGEARAGIISEAQLTWNKAMYSHQLR